MDEARARETLDSLGRSAPEAFLLWRGSGVAGSDIDVVVRSGSELEAARSLRAAGLTPSPLWPGHVMWRLLPGETVLIDALAEYAWPSMYPPFAEVLAHSAPGPNGLAVAAPADRLLMYGAEAVAGWPIDKVLRKVRAARDEPGAQEQLGAQSPPERALAALVEDPDGLASHAAGGRLALRTAVHAASRSRAGRAALRERARARLGLPAPPALPQVDDSAEGRPPGFLVALSGMDGAGKSTTAFELAAALEASGRPAVMAWTRLAGNPRVLDLVARPVRRLLGRSLGGTASGVPALAPPRATGPLAGHPAPRAEQGPRKLIEGAWVVLIALECVRAGRRASRLRRRGLGVVCDRWTTDALVDLRLRYGRHRLAEWVVRHGLAEPDLALHLDIDPATALQRKPGDQPLAVLEQMAVLYEHQGQADNVIDARTEQAVVAEQARGLLHHALGHAGAAERAARRATGAPGASI